MKVELLIMASPAHSRLANESKGDHHEIRKPFGRSVHLRATGSLGCAVRRKGRGGRAAGGGGGNKSKDLLARSVAHTHYRMSNGQI